MKAKIVIGLALVCALAGGRAQVSPLDSLYHVARAEKNDTLRFSHYHKIATQYYQDAKFDELQGFLREKSAEIREYLKQDLNSAEKSTGLRFMALYHHTRASAYYRTSKMEQAWEQLDSSRVICLNLEAQQHLLKVYNLAGAICQFQSLYDSALYYYHHIHDLATELQDTSMMTTALYNQAGVYKRLQQYDKAIELYLKVKELGLALNKQADVGSSHKGLGDVYYYTSQYIKALDHYTKAIRIFEEAENWRGLENALSNIAVVYKEQGEYEAALNNYRRVLAWNKAQKDKKGEANDYLSIGAVYSEMGAMDSSVHYYRKALKLHREINYKPGFAMAYANLGNRLVEMDSLAKGVAHLEKSVGYYRELNFDYELVMVLSLLANAQLEIKTPARAEKSASEAYELSKKLGLNEGIHNSAEVYAAALKFKGDYENAYKYLEESKNLQDTLRNEEIRKKAIRADLQLEFQKKALEDSIQVEQERHTQELAYQASLGQEKQRRTLLIYLSGAGLLLALGFYSRVRYISRSRRIIQFEKDRSDTLLLNILPYEVAEELKNTGKSEAKDFEDVTVLFTDFQEFTETSQQMTAKELVTEINTCFKAFDEIIDHYKIEKIKTIGDAYMAAGGLHEPRTSEPRDIINAALEMQAFMQERKAKRNEEGLPAFQMRVGIHTGPVVAGIVGIKKFQYDIWGDTVNTASRMESAGEVGKVNISQSTYELINDDPQFGFERRGKIVAKGKGLVDMYFVGQA